MDHLCRALQSPLFRRALAEAVLVGGLCGAVGVHVLLRRLAFFAHAAAHATFPGVVAASLLGVSLIGGGAAGSLTLVGITAGIGSVRRLGHATATGIALAGAFATGVLMLTTQPGSSKDLAAFLVGSVLTTTPTDLVATLVAGSGLLVVLFLVHKELVLTAFDPLAAGAMGYPVGAIGVVVLAAVAVTVACAVTAVGTILVVTLLIAPPLTARLWVDRSSLLFVLSAALGAGAGLLGLASSAIWGLVGGAAVTLASAGMLALSALSLPLRRHSQASRLRRHRARSLAAPGVPGLDLDPHPSPVPGGAVSLPGLGGPARPAAALTARVKGWVRAELADDVASVMRGNRHWG